MEDNEDYIKSNREKKLTPRTRTLHWCEYCDKDKVYDSCKCGTCGKVSGIKRFKKDTN